MSSRFHSVRLIQDRCRGCTSCLKGCPTEAIRIQNRKATIMDERCIDCGECIRACSYHAKVAHTDSLLDVQGFAYSVALPAPSLYGQFGHLVFPSQVREALLALGFSQVSDVAWGADAVSLHIRQLLKDEKRPRPYISSACPAVTRLVQARFPSLIPNLLPLRQPMEAAAERARKDAMAESGLSAERIGVFFITPCPAKMTAIHSPLGHATSQVNGAVSMMEVYKAIAPLVDKLVPRPKGDQARFSPFGLGWACSGGEREATAQSNCIVVDGIGEVIQVLEKVEDKQIFGVDYIEAAACPGGCLGGPLTYQNHYLARNALHRLKDSLASSRPEQHVTPAQVKDIALLVEEPILPNNSMQLDESVFSALERMEEVEGILAQLPGFDCGSCGSPSCQSLAEDIVRGDFTLSDCIYIMRDSLMDMAKKMLDMSNTQRE